MKQDSPAEPAPQNVQSRDDVVSTVSSAHSLHSVDHESDEDQLPAYTDESATLMTPATSAGISEHNDNDTTHQNDTSALEYALYPESSRVPGARTPCGSRNPLLSRNPNELRRLILDQAAIPPRPFVIFRGSHKEEREEKGKKESHEIIDFDITVSGGELFQPPMQTPDTSTWHEVKVVPDHVKAYRGGLFATRAKYMTADIENNPNTRSFDDQTLKIWSHYFCSRASDSWLPCTFTLRRHISDWDTATLESRLKAMICQTNYRGHVTVTFPVENETFKVYSSHWMNFARNNKYIWWACVLTQLWILTWPILWLCTSRFEVVHSYWPYKKWVNNQPVYATYSEDYWLSTWGQTIIDAAFSRRKQLLTYEDVHRVMQLQRATQENRQLAANQQQSGNVVVDTVLGIVNGLAESRAQFELVHGWGADHHGVHTISEWGQGFPSNINISIGRGTD